MKYLMLCLGLLLAPLVKAQTELLKSAVFETKDAGFAPKILHVDNELIYGANVAHELIRVVLYNKPDLSINKQFDVYINHKTGSNYHLLELAWIKGSIIAFIQEKNTNSSKTGVKAYRIDMVSHQVAQPVDLYYRSYDSLSEKGTLRVEFDDERIVVHSAVYNPDGNLAEKALAVYDMDFNEIGVFEYSKKLEGLNEDPAFDAMGNTYLEKDRELLILDPNLGKKKRIPFPMIEAERLIPFSFQLARNPSDQIVITAFYQREDLEEDMSADLSEMSDIYDDLAIEGLLYFVYDPSSERFLVERRHQFTQDFVDRFLESSDAGELRRIPQVFTKIELNFNDQGDCYLLGERMIHRSFLSSQRIDLGDLGDARIFSEDLILLKINDMGDLRWGEYIPKMHRYYWQERSLSRAPRPEYELWARPLGEFEYFSFYAHFGEEGLELFYNDYPENKQGRVSYDEVEVYEDYDQGGPVYLQFNPISGAAKRREYWEDLVIEDDLYFKTQNLFYSEEDEVYYGVLSLDIEYQLIRFKP